MRMWNHPSDNDVSTLAYSPRWSTILVDIIRIHSHKSYFELEVKHSSMHLPVGCVVFSPIPTYNAKFLHIDVRWVETGRATLTDRNHRIENLQITLPQNILKPASAEHSLPQACLWSFKIEKIKAVNMPSWYHNIARTPVIAHPLVDSKARGAPTSSP